MEVDLVNLPTAWKTSTLGSVAEGFLSGGIPSTKNDTFWQGTVPWITNKWINSRLYLESGEKLISEDAAQKSATTVAYPKTKEEQDMIVTGLEGLDTKLSVIRRRRPLLSDLFRTSLHQLMTAQIRAHDLDLPELETATQG
jgi:restriction endonuclease S subunit